eukprot:Em0012g781a
MFGRQANIPVDLMDSLNQGQEKELPDYVHQLREGLKETFALVRNLCESEHQRQKAIYTTRRFMENLFSKGDMVWLFSPAVPRGRWKKFHQPWKGPFIVEEKKGSSTFKIKPQVIARPDTPHDDEDLLLSDDEDGEVPVPPVSQDYESPRKIVRLDINCIMFKRRSIPRSMCEGGQGDEQAVGGGEGDGSERGEDGCGHESGGGCGECGDGDDGCGSDDDECGGGDDGCGGPVNSDDVVGASGVDITEDGPVPPPQLDAGSSSSSGDRKLLPPRSPPTAVPSGTKFTLQEMTLQRVLDAHITNPITIATGAINTVAKFMSEGVRISTSRVAAPPPPSGASAAGPTGPLAEDEEKFEVWGGWDRVMAEQVGGTWPASSPTRQPGSSPSGGGPPTPSTPMDRLIGMGFANRELNSQLLEKHNNNIQAVLNELLDGRDSEAVRV